MRIAELQEKLDVAGNAGGREPLVSAGQTSAEGAGAIDWHAMVRLTDLRARSGLFAKQKLLLLDQRIRRMSAEELVDALDALDDASPDMRSGFALGRKLLDALVERSPPTALGAILAHRSERSVYNHADVRKVLHEWAREEPENATEWLDAALAAGDFGRPNLAGELTMHALCESSLLIASLKSRPEAIRRRLMKMTENERAEVFGSFPQWGMFGDRMPSDDELAVYAGLIRETLPDDRRAEFLASPVRSLANQGGVAAVDSYLEVIGGTPEERGLVVRRSVGPVLNRLAREQQLDLETLGEFEQWATKHSDEPVASSLGAALHGCTRGLAGFEPIAELAARHGEERGNDEVLVHFLRSTRLFGSAKNPESWIRNHIEDPQRREAILENLSRSQR